jgi:hypothetical protein
MWFDFTSNAQHDHEVAVVMSVQGINPITGQQVTALNLEQYKTQCPIHEVDFKQDRYCEKCEFKWSAQNYISTTTGQPLWLDGFRNEEGEVRQYIITEEEARGVATQLIGDDKVYAIGFAFYLSKEPKPKQPQRVLRSMTKGMTNTKGSVSLQQCASGDGNLDINYPTGQEEDYWIPVGPEGPSSGFKLKDTNDFIELTPTSNADYCGEEMGFADCEAELHDDESTKKLEVGAGAKIAQEIGIDPKDIDYWSEEPIGLIYVNYVPLKECNRILNEGKREDKADGFMNNLNVGNK